MRIFTVSGELVAELKEEGGRAHWDGRTDGGKNAAAGTYYYVVEVKSSLKKRGRIALVR